MDNIADAAFIGTTAEKLGYWFGSFFIPMIVTYIFLRFAGSSKRKSGMVIILRVLAVLASIFLAYMGYIGSGRYVNPGGLLAVVVTVAWALKQQFARKTA